MMLAHTNPVVFKTTLKEGRGEDRYLCSSGEVLLKTIEKYECVSNLSQVVLSEVVALLAKSELHM